MILVFRVTQKDMPATKYSITRQLPPGLYQSILDYAVGRCATFLLVVRDSLGLSSRALHLLDRLRHSLVRDYRSREWPGTKLVKGTARILEYAYTSDSKDILKEMTPNLYGWKQPDLPEDFCLLRPSGKVWMATIAHEEDAFLEMEMEELNAMLQEVPALADYIEGARGKEEEDTGSI